MSLMNTRSSKRSTTAHPASKAEKTVTLTIDGAAVTVPEGTSIMRAAMEPGRRSRSSAPPTCWMRSAPAGCAWSRSRAAPARRPPAPRRSPNGMVVRTQTERLNRLRKGVMELYVSDHPLDCLTCSANGDCELLDMAGAVGLRDVRYGFDGARHPQSRHRRFESVFHLRSGQMHRLLALRARLRGGARHLRADHCRPRLRFGHCRRAWREVHQIRMRVLRRLRAGLPDRLADREEGDRERHAGDVGGDDLRLLRRRLLVQGGDARRRSGPHGAVQGRQGEPRPFLRQGPLRLGLRQSQGAHPQADDAREDHRAVARSVLGRGDRARRLRVQAHPGEIRQRTRSAASPRRAAPTKKPSWCRSSCARPSATTMSIPAPASAIRRPAMA